MTMISPLLPIGPLGECLSVAAALHNVMETATVEDADRLFMQISDLEDYALHIDALSPGDLIARLRQLRRLLADQLEAPGHLIAQIDAAITDIVVAGLQAPGDVPTDIARAMFLSGGGSPGRATHRLQYLRQDLLEVANEGDWCIQILDAAICDTRSIS